MKRLELLYRLQEVDAELDVKRRRLQEVEASLGETDELRQARTGLQQAELQTLINKTKPILMELK